MESDPLLALAEDARTFGNCHKRTPRSAPSSSEVLATMAAHFKTALERARQQIHLSNQQNRVLVNEAKTKDRLVNAEQLTSSKLLEDKKNLILSLAESREQILALEARVKSLESALEKSETKRTKDLSNHSNQTISEKGDNVADAAPPLPPKTVTKKKSIKSASEQINRPRQAMPSNSRAAPELPEKRRSATRPKS
ncbi:unnamed protein product [Oikopleura dioica]|uniref:Uncharacterized protein n=1 Tax=Oikopleura dioica TaxID=34765 RepID=E4YS55_OIKDI|nr:unnamed protein product [Oikopleura dioica]